MRKQTPKKVARTIEEAEALGLTEIEVEVSQEVYDKLVDNMREGETFSDVIRRMIAMVDAPAVAQKLSNTLPQNA